MDGVYLARPAMVLAEFLDLERVEILRGTQATLYGRHTVGGALNVITKLPSDTFEASARIAAGNLGPRHFTVSPYARKLTNECYITGNFGSPPPAIGGRPAESRMWGVRLAVRLATKQP